MTEQRSALDNALDLLVFAPVGLALTAAEELPKLAAKGRAQVEGQMTMAKMVGQFAVAQGRKEIEKRLGLGAQPKPQPTAQPTPRPPAPTSSTPSNGSGSNPRAENGSYERLSGKNAAGRTTATAPAPDLGQEAAVIDVDFGTAARAEAPKPQGRVGAEANTPSPSASTVAAPSPGAASSPGTTAQRGPSAEGLAIPGYDSLSASQVVQRLAGLSQDELVAVGEYESAHRGRRTILTRVGQLKG